MFILKYVGIGSQITYTVVSFPLDTEMSKRLVIYWVFLI
jgi:hypothetical protein